MAQGQGLELRSIVNVGLMAGAVHQPDLLAFAAVRTVFGEQPLRVAAHGRNAGSGGNQNGVCERFAEEEVAMRPVNLDGAADGQIGQIGQVVGEEAFFHTVDAKIETYAVAAEASE